MPRRWVNAHHGTQMLILEEPRTGSKRCGGGYFSATVPEANTKHLFYFTKTVEVEVTYPPRHDHCKWSILDLINMGLRGFDWLLFSKRRGSYKGVF